MSLAGLTESVRDARWLTQARIVGCGQIMLLVELTILIMLALWQHGLISDTVSSTSSDFVSFYAAGKLVLAGTPALAYDQTAHFLAEQQFTVAGAQYQFFFYPPMFLLLCAPLALLPYSVAFYGFEIATLTAFVLTMRHILRAPGWTWIGPLLAFPAIFWTFGLGQNSFLTASLFGGFTSLLDRRPALAGFLLGLLCYKPHFGLLAPFGLASGGQWRAFFAAGATIAALAGISAGLFGIETWHAYLVAFQGSDAVYGSGRIDYAGMVTVFGAARLLGFNPSLAIMSQVVVTSSMVLLTGLIWRVGASPPLRAASLLAATMLAVPMALLYDQLLLLVAICWLLREARASGFLSWDKAVLFTVYPLSLLGYVVGTVWHVPLAPLVSLAILTLALRRIERRFLMPARSANVGGLISGVAGAGTASGAPGPPFLGPHAAAVAVRWSSNRPIATPAAASLLKLRPVPLSSE